MKRWLAAALLVWVACVGWAPTPVHGDDDESTLSTVFWPANGTGQATAARPALPDGLSVIEFETEGAAGELSDLAQQLALTEDLVQIGGPPVDGPPIGQPAPLGGGAVTVDLPNGRFFAAGDGGTGYAIVDEPGGPLFWTAFHRLGGVDRLGRPISRPFLLPDARVYQATQMALLVWQPGGAEAETADALDLMSAAGLDDWLWERGVPRPLPAAKEPVRGLVQVTGNVVTRLGWLTEPAFQESYYSPAEQELGASTAVAPGMVRYGLPASRPEQFATHTTQRFQRGAMRLSPADPAAGETTAAAAVLPVPVGELLRDSGLLAAALAPDRLVGGSLVMRAPRPQLTWRSDTGWGVVDPVAAARLAPVASAPTGPLAGGTALPGTAAAIAGTPRAPIAGSSGTAATPATTPTSQLVAATATATPSALLQAGASIVVRSIFNQGRAEHVVIANEGTAAQILTGWILRSATGGQTFTFPPNVSLPPGASLRVHSGSGNPATLNRPPSDLFATSSNVWRNTGDTAELLDPSGRLIHRRSYGTP